MSEATPSDDEFDRLINESDARPFFGPMQREFIDSMLYRLDNGPPMNENDREIAKLMEQTLWRDGK